MENSVDEWEQPPARGFPTSVQGSTRGQRIPSLEYLGSSSEPHTLFSPSAVTTDYMESDDESESERLTAQAGCSSGPLARPTAPSRRDIQPPRRISGLAQFMSVTEYPCEESDCDSHEEESLPPVHDEVKTSPLCPDGWTQEC